MKRLTILILVFLLSGEIVTICAQNAHQVRCAKATAMDVYENYVDLFNSMNYQDAYTKDRFFKLFKNTNKIGNDIIYFTPKAALSSSDYYKLFSDTISRVDNEYYNLRVSYPKQQQGFYVMYFSFEKKVTYTDNSNRTYDPLYVSYKFRVLMDTMIRDSRCQNVHINEVSVERLDILAPNPDIVVKESDSDKWTLLSFNTSFGIINDGNQPSNDYKLHNYSDIQLKSTLATIGIDYSLQIASRNKARIFLNIGAAVDMGGINYAGYYTNKYDTIDVDGDAYTRNIDIMLNSEKISLIKVAMPISLSCWFQLMKSKNKSLYLSLEGGGYVGYLCNITNKVDMDASYTGTYHYVFGNVVFDHYYDYSTGHITKRNHGMPKDINHYDFGLEGGIGLIYSLGSNMFKLKVSYLNSLTTMVNYKDNMILSYDESHYESILQSSKNGISSIMVGLSFVKIIN